MRRRISGTHVSPTTVQDYKAHLTKLANKRYDGDRLALKLSMMERAKTRTQAKKAFRIEKEDLER